MNFQLVLAWNFFLGRFGFLRRFELICAKARSTMWYLLFKSVLSIIQRKPDWVRERFNVKVHCCKAFSYRSTHCQFFNAWNNQGHENVGDFTRKLVLWDKNVVRSFRGESPLAVVFTPSFPTHSTFTSWNCLDGRGVFSDVSLFLQWSQKVLRENHLTELQMKLSRLILFPLIMTALLPR